MNILKCPSCKNRAISSYIKLLNIICLSFWLSSKINLCCENCKTRIRINFSFVFEFLLYIIMWGVIINIINYFIELKFNFIISVVGLIISIYLMNYLNRQLIVLDKEKETNES